MQSNHLHAERISLQIQLQAKNEKFDHAIEHEEDCKTAKMLYREIKELKARLKHISQINESQSGSL
jgi:hypothetical protein